MQRSCFFARIYVLHGFGVLKSLTVFAVISILRAQTYRVSCVYMRTCIRKFKRFLRGIHFVKRMPRIVSRKPSSYEKYM